MKFVQAKNYVKINGKERIAIPFFAETDLTRQLAYVQAENLLDKETIVNIYKEDINEVMAVSDDRFVQLLFINLGKEECFSNENCKKVFRKFGKMADDNWVILLTGITVKSMAAAAEGICTGSYRFNKEMLKGAEQENLFSLREKMIYQKEEQIFTLLADENIVSLDQLKKETEKGMDYGRAINYARALSDLPNNYLHVKEFASYAIELANKYGMTYEVLGNMELKRLHSGGILSVNAGSSEEANLVVLTYQGKKDEKPTALIGKGVMFDSGGYHLKSRAGMNGMKYDMCGAANILEVLEIAAKRRLPVHLIGIFPLVENVISSSACKMGDVITTMSGKTVEIDNTDAEGRLILCDAITYAVKKEAKRIIDLATLTYSAQAALGNEYAGIFSNDDEFYQAFENQTKHSGEKIWRLPLGESYHKQIQRTEAADLINYSSDSNAGGGGASVAACFLEEFVEETPWIHLDVVGPSVNRSETPYLCAGATGIMISTIAGYLEGETE